MLNTYLRPYLVDLRAPSWFVQYPISYFIFPTDRFLIAWRYSTALDADHIR